MKENNIKEFLKENKQFSRVEWKSGDLTVWFVGQKEPWSVHEFEKNSETRNLLEQLIERLENL